MAGGLPEWSEGRVGELAHGHIRTRMEDIWGSMRSMGLSASPPETELEGCDLVREALRRGHGAILWCMLLSSGLAIKKAFHDVGLPLVHLSREEHGAFTDTRLGVKVVAPFFCRSENVYLAERVQIPLSGSLAYLHTLRRRLRENACVSIVGEHKGRQNGTVEVMGKRWSFALGAPSLAWTEGAALFTVYALRIGSFRYRVVVEPEIPVDQSLPRKVFALRAVEEFARRLEKAIERQPCNWQGWSLGN
jgi:lauroyl/myristoyl acyltransferase